jgi:hypothetical protein
VRRGAERAFGETDATMSMLQRDISRLEEENEVMVQQIVDLTKGLQEAKDIEDEAWMLRRQHVQMFRGFTARLMEATRCLGFEGLALPSVPEDDGAILCFFGQLADKLVEASAKVAELIDTECWELLALAGTRIFSNVQRLHPKLDLEELLQRRAATPHGASLSGPPGHRPPSPACHLRPPRNVLGRRTGELLQRRGDELRGIWQ